MYKQMHTHTHTHTHPGKTITKQTPLNNKSNSKVYITASCEPPELFKVSSYSSINTATITLAGSGATAAAAVQAAQTSLVQGAIKFNGAPITLHPGEHMTMLVKYYPPLASDPQRWPLHKRVSQKGSLQLQFSNGLLQEIPLEGLLLRPSIVCSPSEHHFGMLHTKSRLSSVGTNKQTKRIKLGNASQANATWKLVHVPRPKRNRNKSAMDPGILAAGANAEWDDKLDWVDDETCFDFTKLSGTISANGEGELEVVFAPKTRSKYYCQFRVEVANAALEEQDQHMPLTTIHLTGEGSFDEHDDHDYDTHY